MFLSTGMICKRHVPAEHSLRALPAADRQIMSPHQGPGWVSASVYACSYITICGRVWTGRDAHRLQLRLQPQPPDPRFSARGRQANLLGGFTDHAPYAPSAPEVAKIRQAFEVKCRCHCSVHDCPLAFWLSQTVAFAAWILHWRTSALTRCRSLALWQFTTACSWADCQRGGP
jgi:hypothetical protein